MLTAEAVAGGRLQRPGWGSWWLPLTPGVGAWSTQSLGGGRRTDELSMGRPSSPGQAARTRGPWLLLFQSGSC